jgi:hypothetical protein
MAAAKDADATGAAAAGTFKPLNKKEKGGGSTEWTAERAVAAVPADAVRSTPPAVVRRKKKVAPAVSPRKAKITKVAPAISPRKRQPPLATVPDVMSTAAGPAPGARADTDSATPRAAKTECEFDVLCCTVNAANTNMTATDLAAWVPKGGLHADGTPYDVIAIGMQRYREASGPLPAELHGVDADGVAHIAAPIKHWLYGAQGLFRIVCSRCNQISHVFAGWFESSQSVVQSFYLRENQWFTVGTFHDVATLKG